LLIRPGAVAAEAVGAVVDAGIAAHYGDPAREQRTLANEVGLVDRSNREVLVIGGEDRLGWLHSMSTQYLTDLPGGTETLFLSPHGHVEHHAVVLDDGTATYFDVEPGTGAGLLDFLNRMRFLMRVSPELSDLGVVSLVGPATDDALSMLGVGPMKGPDTVPVPGPKFAAGA